MSTFAQLTPDQQNQVLAFMAMFRPNIGLTARALNQMSQMDSIWTNNISPLVTGLDAGTPIPDSPGLAGAVTLIREEIMGLMASVQTCLSTYNLPANRTEFVRAAGLPNTVG